MTLIFHRLSHNLFQLISKDVRDYKLQLSILFYAYRSTRTICLWCCVFVDLVFCWALVLYRNGTGKSSCSNLTNSIFWRYDEFIREREAQWIHSCIKDSHQVLLPLFCFDTFRRQNGKCITLKLSMRSTFHRQVVTPRGYFPMHDRRFELEANANKQHIL